VQFREIYVSRLSRPGVIAHPRVARGHGGSASAAPARDEQRSQCGGRPDRGQVQGFEPAVDRDYDASAACTGSSASEVQPPGLLLGISSVAIVVVTLSGLASTSATGATRPRCAQRADGAPRDRGGPLLARLTGGGRPGSRRADAAEPERGLGVEPVTLYEADGSDSSSMPSPRTSAAPGRPAGQALVAGDARGAPRVDLRSTGGLRYPRGHALGAEPGERARAEIRTMIAVTACCW